MTTTSSTSTTQIGVSSSGTVFFSGTASGLDTQSLITNAVNAKLLKKVQYTDQISTNTAKITAFQALETQGASLAAALKTLSSATLNSTDNPFSTTQVTSSSSDGTSGSGILNASTASGAQSGNYNVVVDTLAQSLSVASAVQTSATTGLGYNGTFQIGEDGKTASTITVTATTTLSDLRDQINASTVTSGVKADILQQANGQYKLIITGNDTAKNVSVTGVTGDNALNNLGVTDASNNFLNVVQPAQQAHIVLNGNDVYSDSNTLSNVLTGLTINLTNAAPSTTVTLKVGSNTTGATNAITTFVNAYNTLQNSIAAYRKVNADGSVDTNASLYGETTNSQLGTMLTSLVSTTYGSGVFNGLRSLGISLDANNNLVIDSAALSDALTNHFDDVKSVFTGDGSGTTGLADIMNTQLDAYTNSNTGLIQTQINSLTSTDTDLQTKADAVQAAADQYQLQLINTYANLETAMQNADLLKQQITAILTGSTPSK